MTMESKIAEIVREISLGLIGRRKGTDSILALIAADRAERVCKKCLKAYDAPSLCPVCQLKSTDDAFDKGFETGKTEGQIEATRDRAGLVEALTSILNESAKELTPCTNRIYRIAFKALKGEGK